MEASRDEGHTTPSEKGKTTLEIKKINCKMDKYKGDWNSGQENRVCKSPKVLRGYKHSYADEAQKGGRPGEQGGKRVRGSGGPERPAGARP